MATPANVAITKAEEAMRQILEKLPVEQILKFREHTKTIHYRQLQMMSEILQTKGYVEPHHEDLLEHGRD